MKNIKLAAETINNQDYKLMIDFFEKKKIFKSIKSDRKIPK